jgi:hypothetical protein
LHGWQEVEWREAMGLVSRIRSEAVCKPQTLVARRPKQVPVATGDKANKSPMFFLIAALGSSEPRYHFRNGSGLEVDTCFQNEK